MSEKIRTISIDLVAVCCAWLCYYLFRIKSGWLTYSVEPDFIVPMIAVGIFWLIIFFFFGLYRPWYAKSRFDEFATIFKATTFGVLFLFFAIFIDDGGVGSPLKSRLLILLYWVLMLTFVGSGRFLMHTFQRRLLMAGIGLRNTLIVGWSDRARELFKSVKNSPALGYKIIGIVPVTNGKNDSEYDGIPIKGVIEDLPMFVDESNVREILIALDSSEHDNLLRIIATCNTRAVGLKIIPDLYDIISGQARTNQIYGFPLIEIMPEIMQPWERAIKRTLDILFSAIVLLIGLPIWILVAIAIKIDTKGPVFYTQERVGKDEKHFPIIKFRTMFANAESESGPVWANRQDPRVTRVGKILRKLRVDEIPQLINILDGNMSLVGPRPERPFFVEQLSKEIPLYKRRLKVRPGITGWAQVKHKYDENIEDVRKKVQYDLFYIENMSLRMDFKILLNTITVVLLGKGH
ncbi:MAG: sugar transferase [Ignavibacteriales bacterium]|nr:sugar transferase [Ignavibacteriales bacterium]